MILYYSVSPVKMSIDKSWIYLENRLSDQFWNGLASFMNIAKDHVNSVGETSCPCRKCRNGKMWSLQVVHAHIHRWGFDTSYKAWVFHGEPNIEEIHASHVASSEPVDEMLNILNDIAGVGGDNDQHDAVPEDEFDLDEDQYKDLYDDLETPLYPGCTTFSALNLLVKMLCVKALYKIPNEGRKVILKMMKVNQMMRVKVMKKKRVLLILLELLLAVIAKQQLQQSLINLQWLL